MQDKRQAPRRPKIRFGTGEIDCKLAFTYSSLLGASAKECLHGIDSGRSFEAVCTAVIENSGHLDLLLAAGDLSVDQSTKSYAYLTKQFNAGAIPSY